MGDNAESADAVIIYDRKWNPAVILPPGTKRVNYNLKIPGFRPNEDETDYVCPDGDLIRVDNRNGKIRNTTKDIDLGSL